MEYKVYHIDYKGYNERKPMLLFKNFNTILIRNDDIMHYNTNKRRPTIIDNRRLSVIVFSLFFSWMLAFLFEGRMLYAVAEYYGVSVDSFVFLAIAANFAGLIVSGFFVKSIATAKRLVLFSIAFCIATCCVFFSAPSYLWMAALISSAFAVGCCVAAWGFYLKYCSTKDSRIKTIADGLIFSNIMMIALNMTAIYISPRIGLACCILVLVCAFMFALRLPKEVYTEADMSVKQRETYICKPGMIAFLCLFIIVISINSGLMYQAQGPAFAHLEWLTSWYWAVPYIMAIFIMRNLPRKINRAYILYVAIAMIGFSFIAFLSFDRSWASYIVVNTLMLAACGVYDLFWWSILGEMLEFEKKPALIMGVGLSANVLGILMGGLIGKSIYDNSGVSQNPTLIALCIVCVTLIMLPPLHKRLNCVLKNHIFLTAFNEMPTQIQKRIINENDTVEKLTEREGEIAALLIKGNTYKIIASELNVSENTVKTHVKNIYSKAGVQSRTELMYMLLNIKDPVKHSDNT